MRGKKNEGAAGRTRTGGKTIENKSRKRILPRPYKRICCQRKTGFKESNDVLRQTNRKSGVHLTTQGVSFRGLGKKVKKVANEEE